MAGSKNDVVVGKNADFSQAGAPNATTSEANGLATNGQLWIGTTALNAGGTHINVGTLTSPNASITFGYSSPNITAVTSGAVLLQTTEDSGTATPSAGNLNVLSTLVATNINNHPVSTTGSGSTITLNWNNILPPTIAGSGTVNLTYADYGVIYGSPGPLTVNLPQTGSSGISNGKMFFIAGLGNTAASNVTINAFAGDNINGLASYVLNTNYQSVTLMYGTNQTWVII